MSQSRNALWLKTLSDVEKYFNTVECGSELQAFSREERNNWVSDVLNHFDYTSLGREHKGVIRKFLQKATGCSRAQVARLIQKQCVSEPVQLKIEKPARTFITLERAITIVRTAINWGHLGLIGALLVLLTVRSSFASEPDPLLFLTGNTFERWQVGTEVAGVLPSELQTPGLNSVSATTWSVRTLSSDGVAEAQPLFVAYDEVNRASQEEVFRTRTLASNVQVLLENVRKRRELRLRNMGLLEDASQSGRVYSDLRIRDSRAPSGRVYSDLRTRDSRAPVTSNIGSFAHQAAYGSTAPSSIDSMRRNWLPNGQRAQITALIDLLTSGGEGQVLTIVNGVPQWVARGQQVGTPRTGGGRRPSGGGRGAAPGGSTGGSSGSGGGGGRGGGGSTNSSVAGNGSTTNVTNINGAFTAGDGVSYLTTATDNVGIGTSTPETKLEVIGTISGSVVYAADMISTSGALIFESSASGKSLYLADTIEGAGLYTDCDGSTKKITWDITTKRFKCETDLNTGGASFDAGAGLALDGTTFRLASNLTASTLDVHGTLSGFQVYARDSLASSGTLVFEGAASGQSLYLADSIEGAGLYSDCTGTSNKLTWNATSKRFQCEADQDTSTTYAAGAGLALDGTTFRLAGNITGSTIHAETSLTTSGTLVFEGAASGSSLYLGSTFEGAGLVSDCDGASNKVTWDSTTKRFKCESDQDTDTNTTYSAGANLALDGTTFRLASNLTASTLDVHGTLSGFQVYARDSLASSGTLVFEGAASGQSLYLADSIEGAGLYSDCTGTSNKLTWNATSKRFQCEADQDTSTTYAAGAGLALDGTTFRLAGNITGSTIHAETSLTTSGTLVFEGAASGSSLYLGSTFEGAGLVSDCDGASNKVTWDSTTKRFKCESDQDTDTNTTYSAGANLALDGTTFRLASNLTASTLDVHGTLSGFQVYARDSLASSGTLVFEGAASGQSLYLADSIEGAGLYSDCTGTSNKLTWNATSKRFQCEADQDTSTTYAAGAGLALDGTTFRLAGNITGSTIHAETSLTTSGTLVFEGAASGSSLYLGSTFEGAGLVSDCDGASNKVTWDSTTKRFKCESDQDTDTNTTYSAGANLALDGTTFRLASNLTASTLDVHGTLSGFQVYARDSLASSGTLVFEGAASGQSLYLADSIEGAGLYSDCTGTSNKLTWNATSKRFQCEADQDTSTTYAAGAGLALDGTTFRLAGNITGSTIHAETSLTTSGTLVFEGAASGSSLYLGSTFEGAGLVSDCDGASNKVTWDSTTKRFKCESDQDTDTNTTYSAGANLALDGTTFRLASNLTASTLDVHGTLSGFQVYARDSLASSGTLVFEGAASGQSLYLADSIEGAGLYSDCTGTSNKLTWNATSKRFQCEADQDTSTTYAAGAGLALDGTTFRLAGNITGSTIHAETSLTTSGTLVFEGAASGSSLYLGSTFEGAGLVSDCDGASNKVTWDSTTKRFKCESDQDTDTNTTYSAGANLALDGTTFRLASNLTASTLDVHGTLSGFQVYARDSLASSGTLVFEGAASGQSLYLADSIEGAGLYSDCTGTSNKLTWNATSKRFQCEADQDTSTTYAAGAGLALDGTTFRLAGNITGSTIHAETSLTTSGTLVFEGAASGSSLYLGSTFEGAGLVSDCDGASNKVTWDSTTKRFKCESDQDTDTNTTYSAGANLALDGTTFRLASNLTASTLDVHGTLSGFQVYARDSLASSGTLVFEGAASGQSLYLADSIEGAGLYSDCTGTSNKLTWNATSKRFQCEADQDTSTTYAAGAGLALDGTTFRLAGNITGSTIHAETSLTTSGTLVFEGAASGSSLYLGSTFEGAGLVSDCDGASNKVTWDSTTKRFKCESDQDTDTNTTYSAGANLALDGTTFRLASNLTASTLDVHGTLSGFQIYARDSLASSGTLVFEGAASGQSLYLADSIEGAGLYSDCTGTSNKLTWNATSKRFQCEADQDTSTTYAAGAGLALDGTTFRLAGNITGSTIHAETSLTTSGTLVFEGAASGSSLYLGSTFEGAGLVSDCDGASNKVTWDSTTKRFKCESDQDTDTNTTYSAGANLALDGTTFRLASNLTASTLDVHGTLSGFQVYARDSLASSGTLVFEGAASGQSLYLADSIEGAGLYSDCTGTSNKLTWNATSKRFQCEADQDTSTTYAAGAGLALDGTTFRLAGNITGSTIHAETSLTTSGTLVFEGAASGSSLYLGSTFEGAGLVSDCDGASNKVTWDSTTKRFKCESDQDTDTNTTYSAGANLALDGTTFRLASNLTASTLDVHGTLSGFQVYARDSLASSGTLVFEGAASGQSLYLADSIEGAGLYSDCTGTSNKLTWNATSKRFQCEADQDTSTTYAAGAGLALDGTTFRLAGNITGSTIHAETSLTTSGTLVFEGAASGSSLYLGSTFEGAGLVSDCDGASNKVTWDSTTKRFKCESDQDTDTNTTYSAGANLALDGTTFRLASNLTASTLDVHGTLSGFQVYARDSLASSGTLVFEGAASGQSLYLADSIEGAGLYSDCTGTSNKLTWNATSKRFQCEADQDTSTTYAAGAGLALDGTTFRLAGNITGSTIHAETSLTTSGTLVFEGAASGSSLYLGSTFEGAGLVSDCDGASNKVTWDSTTKRFKCESDQDTDTNTTYSAGANLALDGTTFRLASNLTASTLDVHGTLSGFQVYARDSLASSGTLVFEGAASGQSLYLADSIEGAGLYSDCTGTSNKLTWNATSKRFQCEADQDTSTTYAAGAGLALDGTTFRLAGNITGSTIHAETSLTTSGTLVFEGAASGSSLYLGSTFEGAGLVSDCDGASNKVTWDSTTKRFKCESDQDTDTNTTYSAGANLALDGTTFRLASNLTASTLDVHGTLSGFQVYARDSLASSGTLVFEGAASGQSLYLADSIEGAGLYSDCTGTSNKLTWNATSKRFQCEADQDTSTTYAAGAGLALDGTTFRLAGNITGSTIHAETSLTTSGTLVFEGAASGSSLYLGSTFEGAGLVSDCDGASNKVTWDSTTKRFKCESDQDTDTNTTYSAGANLALDGTTFRLASNLTASTLDVHGTLSGFQVYARDSLASSGTLVFEGAASGQSLYLADSIEGAGLYSDCTGTSNKLTWNATSKRFQCEADQDTSTTYAAGAGLALDGTTFRLAGNITGSTIHAETSLTTSGTLVFEGAASGSSLYLGSTFEGAGLVSDCDGASNKVTWDSTTKRFKCESDQDTDTNTTYSAGANLALDGTTFRLASNLTASTLDVHGTLSGFQVYARDSLASSGTLVFEGAASGQSLYLADSIEGAGLYSDCTGTSNKLTWNATSKRFQCEADQDTSTTYAAGAGLALDGTTFRLAGNITGSTIHAETSLTTSGTLVFEGAASGSSLYLGSTFEGAGLVSDCDGASNKVTWDSTTKRFKCESDQDTDTNTTYSAGANLALDGTTFRLASNLTASTLDVHGTLSGFQVYARDSLASSGTLVFEGAASGQSLYLADSIEGAGLYSDCTGTSNKLTWNATSKRFQCEADQDTSTTYAAGAGLALDGTTFRLAGNITGSTIHAETSLTTSGTLVFEGAASGSSLYLGSTFEGAGLVSDCDGASNKVTWDSTTKRFKCESDQDTDTNTTYSAGANLALDGTTFRLASNLTASTLDVHGTLSGFQVYARDSLASSGTLVFEGAASGQSLYLADSIEGAGLYSDCTGTSNKLTWNATSKRFQCEADQDTSTTYAAGAGLALDGTTFRLAGNITGSTIHAETSLTTSGTLVFEGAASGSSLYLGSTFEGAGLVSDCDGASNKVTWDSTTKRFKCESDQDTDTNTTYSAGANLALDGTTFRLASNLTASTLDVHGTLSGFQVYARDSLASSGTLVFEGAASGQSLYLADSIEGAGLYSDCTGTSNKLTWNATSKRFQCEADQDTSTTYAAGAGLALDGTTFRLAGNITGSTIHAETSLTTSGTLVFEGAASGSSLYLGSTFEGAGLVSDCDGASNKVTWDSTTKRFKCESDQDTDTNTTYSAGANLALDGTTFRLASNLTASTLDVHGTLSGFQVYARDSLASSGTLVFEGAASGQSLYLADSIEGAGLYSDCTGTSNKLTWNATSKRFQCEADQDTSTTYAAGAGLALDGTTFRLAGNITGSTIHAETSLTTSGTLVFEGAASGSSLYLGSTFEGAGLVSDCDGASNKVTWDSTTKRFKCESDQDTDTNTTYSAGANLALDGTTFRLASNLTASTLDVHGTLSGFQVYARDSLASSGTLVFEGAASGQSLYLADSIEGAGLYSDCTGTSNKLTWNATSKRFQCEADQDTSTTYAAGAGLALDGTTFRLAGNITGSTIHAETSLTTSGTLVFEGAASGSSLYLGSTFEGAGLVSDCDGASNKLTWNATSKRFQCEADQDTSTTYAAGAGLALDGTTFRLAGNITGSTIHAETSLTTSGTLVFEGAASGSSLYLGSTFEGAGLVSDCDGASNKVTWDSTTKRFKCESDQDTDTNTTYSAGANLALDGTTFRLAAALTASTLDVHGTLSGFQIYARDSLASSGTLVWEGAGSGYSLYLGSGLTLAYTIEGAGLSSDCDGASNKITWDITTKKFKCESDQGGGSVPNFDEVYQQSIDDTNLTMEIDDTTGLIFDLTTTGDFLIHDSGFLSVTFGDNGITSFGSTEGAGQSKIDGIGDVYIEDALEVDDTVYMDGGFTAGGIGAQSYNAISAAGTAGETDLGSTNDLYIEGSLEVDDTVFFDANVSFDAEILSTDNAYIVISDAINVGGISGVAYNAFSDSGTANTANSDDDVYIEDILEVDGSLDMDGTSHFSALATFEASGEAIRVGDGLDNIGYFVGSGSPESSVSAQIGSMYHDYSNGKLYIKQTGDGTNTGWIEMGIAGDHPNFDEVYAQSISDGNLTMEIDDTGGLIFDLTTTGDFILHDAGSVFAKFDDSGVVRFASGDNEDHSEISGIGDVYIEGDLELDAFAFFDGNVEIGNETTDYVQFNAYVSGSVLPMVSNAYDLGSTDNRWRDLYLSGSSMHIGDSLEEAILGYGNSRFTLSTNSDNVPELVVDNSGYMGIGTTAPETELEVQGAMSGVSLYLSNTVEGAGLYTDCDGTSNKITWDLTTKRFKCESDESGGTAYAAGAGLELDNTTFRLAANITGVTIQASASLASSGTLVWEGAASGASLYVADGFEGSGLTDCDAATATLNWDATTKRFSCGTDSDTTYAAGAGLELDNTTFRLAANITGVTIQASASLASSGTLVWEGAASGASLYVADGFEGSGLTDCDDPTATLNWDATTKRFSCGTDADIDTDTTYTAGAGLELDNTTFRLAANITGVTIQASASLASSGTLVFEGAASGSSLYLGSTFEGAGLSADCDGSANKVTWDATTKRFKCESDQGGGGGSYYAGAGLEIDGTTFRLSSTITGVVIQASDSLASSGTLVFEGAGSGKSLYLSDTFEGAGLYADCDGSSNKVTWDLTTKRFKCESDQGGGGGSYYAGAGLEIDGTTFRLSSVLTGVTITATTALTSSGTLDVAGDANFRGVLSGKIIHAEDSLTSSGILVVTQTGTFAGNLVPYLGNYGTMKYADGGGDSIGTYGAIDCPAEDDCKIITFNSTDSAIEFIDCDNSTCSSRTVTQLQNAGVGSSYYMDIDCPTGDDCKIAYADSSGYATFLDCNNATCSSPSTNGIESDGTYNAVALDCPSATDCKVVYISSFDGELYMADCNDATCSSPSVNAVTSFASLSPIDDATYYLDIDCPSATDCKVVYMSSSNLQMVDCDAATCANGSNTDTTVDSSGSATGFPSIDCPSATDCKIAYYYNSSDLYMADCDNATCSSNTLTAVQTTDTIGHYTNIACPAADNCKIVTGESGNSDLQFVDCENATCSSSNLVSIDTASTGTYNGISCPSSTTCRIISEDSTNNDQNYYACDGETCTKQVDLGTTGTYFTSVYAGTFYGKNTTVQSFDVAENYPTLDTSLSAGDVVSLTGSGMFIGKSTGVYDSKIFGVVSTDPGLLLANWTHADQHPQRPVALNGRVPVKISTENGEIKVGDYLTSSSVPGVAMKATEEGPVIGRALDDYSSAGVSKIDVFVEGFHKESDDILAVSSGATITTQQTNGADNALVILSQAGEVNNRVFRVTASGAVFTDGAVSTTGADYAEWFRATDENLPIKGEVVCIDPTQENAVKRCDRDGDSNVMGIVSTNPAFIGNQITGADGLTPPGHVLVGLIGQVPAKVLVGSGTIRPGDALTPADIAGYARRALPGEPTVGIALEGAEEDSVVNVLISRRNSSVTVETVEESVLETIASMEIEDEVEIMVSDAIDNLNVDSDIADEVERQINEIDIHAATEATLRERFASLNFPVGFGSGATVKALLRATDAVLFEDELTVRGPVTISGAILAQDAAFGGHITVSGSVLVDGDLDVAGAISAGSLEVAEDVSVNGTLTAEKLAASGSTFFGTTEINGTLTINGEVFDPADISIASGSMLSIGELVVDDTVIVLGKATFKELVKFEKNVIVEEDLDVRKEIVVSSSTAGLAKIPKHGTAVTIPFDPPIDCALEEDQDDVPCEPIITAASDTFDPWRISFRSQTGFTIAVKEPAEADIVFNWHALGRRYLEMTEGHAAAPVQESEEDVIDVPVDEHGVPVSSNDVWNACIRSQVVLDESGQPFSCSRYHEEGIWTHPDLGIAIDYDAERDPALTLPEGYRAVVVEEEAEEVEGVTEEDAEDASHAGDTEEEQAEEVAEEEVTEEETPAEETTEEESSEEETAEDVEDTEEALSEVETATEETSTTEEESTTEETTETTEETTETTEETTQQTAEEPTEEEVVEEEAENTEEPTIEETSTTEEESTTEETTETTEQTTEEIIVEVVEDASETTVEEVPITESSEE